MKRLFMRCQNRTGEVNEDDRVHKRDEMRKLSYHYWTRSPLSCSMKTWPWYLELCWYHQLASSKKSNWSYHRPFPSSENLVPMFSASRQTEETMPHMIKFWDDIQLKAFCEETCISVCLGSSCPLDPDHPSADIKRRTQAIHPEQHDF